MQRLIELLLQIGEMYETVLIYENEKIEINHEQMLKKRPSTLELAILLVTLLFKDDGSTHELNVSLVKFATGLDIKSRGDEFPQEIQIWHSPTKLVSIYFKHGISDKYFFYLI